MTAPAGSEDAGLVLSAEEVDGRSAAALDVYNCPTCRHHWHWHADGSPLRTVCKYCDCTDTLNAHAKRAVEAARAEERERIAAEISNMDRDPDWESIPNSMRGVVGAWLALAARIARTPPPAGDAQGSQEARNGPVSDGEPGDGRGRGRDDESGRGAGL